jgi:hypothetical protein
MASPNLSGASASNSVESAATEATNIKAPLWGHRFAETKSWWRKYHVEMQVLSNGKTE